jgi:TonB family protein
MRDRRFLFLVLVFLTISRVASAQDVLTVDKLTLNQHVDHRVAPLYPPIAKVAKIQGTVVFDIRIGVTGKVESMKVISGPAMLQQAATDALKHWTYHPFEKDGAPVPASGVVSIDFDLGADWPTPKEEEIASRYFPSFDQCTKMLSSRSFQQASVACEQSARIAEEFAPEVRFTERRIAFVYAATALADIGDLKSALPWAEKAVNIVKLGHSDDSGNNAAYSARGTIEGMMGDLTAADQDLTLAEDYERKGIADMEKEAPGTAKYDRSVLARDLRFHAQVLQGLNHPEDSQRKLDEATKLN